MNCKFCGGETIDHAGKNCYGTNAIHYQYCPSCKIAMKEHEGNYQEVSKEVLDKLSRTDFEKLNFALANKIKELKPVPTFLDFGCSTGKMVLIMKQLGYDTQGYDVCKTSVEIAKEKGLNCTTKLEDLKPSYDIVWCCETIEHLENPKTFFEFAKLKCKKDGIVYIQTQEPKFNEDEEFLYAYQKEHTHLFTNEYLDNEMQKKGFKLILQGRNKKGCIWGYWKNESISVDSI